MGERLICIQEVSGSIPLGSTIYSLSRATVFGLRMDEAEGSLLFDYVFLAR